MASVDVPIRNGGFGRTVRRDRWWIQPLVIFLGLSSFLIYANWAAFQGEHYRHGPYLSPFYSPELWGGEHSFFGPKPAWWPGWLPFTAALVILWAPAGFRVTCYYYRGAYYKAFWADPVACTVTEPRKTYVGENSLPRTTPHIPRYFFYLACVLLLFLAHDVWKAMWFTDASG